MPDPKFYSVMIGGSLGPWIQSYGYFLGEEKKLQSTADEINKIKYDGSVVRIYQSDDPAMEIEHTITKPSNVKKITSTLSSLLVKTNKALENTKKENNAYAYTMLSIFQSELRLALNGADFNLIHRTNPFYNMRTSRIPNLINPRSFTGKPPVRDQATLINQLKDPGRELSGLVEANILMKQFPFMSMLDKITDNMLLMEQALRDSDKMSLEDQETLRQRLLNGCRSIRTDAERLANLTDEEMAAFSKILDSADREAKVEDWKGKRGIKTTIITPLDDVQMALENHVPFSHLDVIIQASRFTRNVESKLETPGLKDVKGIDDLKKELGEFKKLVHTDFSTLSPKEAADRMNQIGEASRSLFQTAEKIKSGLPGKVKIEYGSMTKEDILKARQINNLHTALEFKSLDFEMGDRGLSDRYVYSKLSNNVSLKVMGARPKENRINNNVINEQPRQNVVNQPRGNRPKPENYGVNTLIMGCSLIQGYGAFLGEDNLQTSIEDIMTLQLQPDVRVERPYLSDEPGRSSELAISKPEKVNKATGIFSSMCEKILTALNKTDKEKDPYTHALLSSYYSDFDNLASGRDLTLISKTNPFYKMRSGRIPDLISTRDFTGKAPVKDPAALIEELKKPDRELSGLEEANILMQRFPYASMIEKITDNMVLLERAMHDSDKMSLEDQEKLRKQMLDGCQSILADANTLSGMSDKDMTAFSKIFAPRGRQNALKENWLGDRGVVNTLSEPLENLQTALRNHVPFSHLDVMTQVFRFAQDMEEKLKLSGMAEAKGFADLEKEHRKFKDIINTDFSTLSPEQAAERMNQIGEASRSLVQMAKKVKASLPEESHMESYELRKLPEEKRNPIIQNDKLHRALEIDSLSKEVSDRYIYSKLDGNVRLNVMGARSQANRINDNVINEQDEDNFINDPLLENVFDAQPLNNINFGLPQANVVQPEANVEQVQGNAINNQPQEQAQPQPQANVQAQPQPQVNVQAQPQADPNANAQPANYSEVLRTLRNTQGFWQIETRGYKDFRTALTNLNNGMREAGDRALNAADVQKLRDLAAKTKESWDVYSGQIRTRTAEREARGRQMTELDRRRSNILNGMRSLLEGDLNALRNYDPTRNLNLQQVIQENRGLTADIRGRDVQVLKGYSNSRMVLNVNGRKGVFSEDYEVLPLYTVYERQSQRYPQLAPFLLSIPETVFSGFDLENVEQLERMIRERSNPSLNRSMNSIARPNQVFPPEYNRQDGLWFENPAFVHDFADALYHMSVDDRTRHAAGAALIDDERNIPRRNAAVSMVADRLGMPHLIARSKVMKVETEQGAKTGVFMEWAEGTDLMRMQGKVIPELMGKPRKINTADAIKAAANLQVIDYICGNTDRNAGNMLYQFEERDGVMCLTGLQGIDNDTSMGRKEGNHQFGKEATPDTLRVMTRSAADAVLRMTKEDLKYSLYGLVEDDEIEFAWKRTADLQNKIRESLDKKWKYENSVRPGAIRIMDEDSWVWGRLELSELAANHSNNERGGIFYQMAEAVKTLDSGEEALGLRYAPRTRAGIRKAYYRPTEKSTMYDYLTVVDYPTTGEQISDADIFHFYRNRKTLHNEPDLIQKGVNQFEAAISNGLRWDNSQIHRDMGWNDVVDAVFIDGIPVAEYVRKYSPEHAADKAYQKAQVMAALTSGRHHVDIAILRTTEDGNFNISSTELTMDLSQLDREQSFYKINRETRRKSLIKDEVANLKRQYEIEKSVLSKAKRTADQKLEELIRTDPVRDKICRAIPYDEQVGKEEDWVENRINQEAVQKEKKRLESKLQNIPFNNVRQAFAENPAPAPAQNVQAPAQNVQAPAQNVQAPAQNVQAPAQNAQAPAQNVRRREAVSLEELDLGAHNHLKGINLEEPRRRPQNQANPPQNHQNPPQNQPGQPQHQANQPGRPQNHQNLPQNPAPQANENRVRRTQSFNGGGRRI